jgi:glycosyltransferase involved in cell wall biosynthesis
MTVDIMLPYYGDPALLRLAVDSVRSQHDPDWRLTVVDDGYPDETVPKWFDSLRDERIHYRRNERNLGANANYRKCLDLIENEIVVLMGADDVMLPNYVSTIRRMGHSYPEAGIMQPGVELIDETGRPYRTLVDAAKKLLYAPRVREPRVMRGEELATSLLRGNWMYFPALAWRTEALRANGFRDGLNVVQDLALVIDLVLRGETMVLGNGVCFQYRRHRGSDSSVRAINGDRFIEERDYFHSIAGELDGLGWHRAATAARNHFSSRLHALSILPRAIRRRNTTGVRNLVHHAFAPSQARAHGKHRKAPR